MPHTIKCIAKDCQKEFTECVDWKPPNSTWYLICPHCKWCNKKQIKRSSLDAWFHTDHDMKIRTATEAVEDMATIIMVNIKSLNEDEMSRLSYIRENMEVLNESELTPNGTTDDDFEVD